MMARGGRGDDGKSGGNFSEEMRDRQRGGKIPLANFLRHPIVALWRMTKYSFR